MTATEIMELAIRLFDEQTDGTGKFDQDSRVLLLQLLNIKYIEVCEETKCSRISSYFNTVSGTREYNLCTQLTGFSSLKEISYTDSGSNLFLLQRYSEKDKQGSSGTIAYGYYQDGETLGFVLNPDGVYRADCIYYSIPTTSLAAGSTPTLVPTRFHYVLAYGLCYEMFRIDKGARDGKTMEWRGYYEEEKRKLAERTGEEANADSYIPV